MYQSGVRVEGALLTGKIKAWECTKGYGFVSNISDGGEDIFVHHTSVICKDGFFPAITPGTQVRLTYHCRQGRDTGINVTDPDGEPLPGYSSKNEAVKQIEGEPEPPSPGRKTGVIRYFNQDKGFGFIQPDKTGVGSRDTFVHMNEVNGELVSLDAGDKVEYNLGIVEGRYRAINVVCTNKETTQTTTTTIGQQATTSVIYNPETGTFQYANAATPQYGTAGGMVYVDPATYGYQQPTQTTGQYSYMMPQGTGSLGLSTSLSGSSSQLQPGQTFYHNGQLYMIPPAQTSKTHLPTQSKVDGSQQYMPQPSIPQPSMSQPSIPQSSIAQPSMSQLNQYSHLTQPQGLTNPIQQSYLQQPYQYTTSSQYTLPIQSTQPTQSLHSLQPSRKPSYSTLGLLPQQSTSAISGQVQSASHLPETSTSKIQHGYKRPAIKSPDDSTRSRKMFRTSLT